MNSEIFQGLRLLYVGSEQWSKMGSRYYNTPQKLVNGFTRLGAQALHFSDRDYARSKNFLKSRKLGAKAVGRYLLSLAVDYKPHVIFIGHVQTLSAAVLEEVRNQLPNVLLVHINIDALFVPDNLKNLQKTADQYDWLFSTTKIAPEFFPHLKRCKIGYMPNPVDRAVEVGKAFSLPTHSQDLILCCGQALAGDERYDIPQEIRRQMPELNFRHFLSKQDGGLWGIDYMQQVGQSKMGLNLSRKREKDPVLDPRTWRLYSSDRIAHLLGNGVLTFTDSAFGLAEIYGDKSMAYYQNVNELIEQLRRYHTDDALRIRTAERGWKIAHEEFSSEKVAAHILSTVLNVQNPMAASWCGRLG